MIDPDKAFCEHLCASYNVNAVLGDPCRQFILEEAGIRNYDVIPLGREDTDNFEICQMGRKVLGIKRSVCLVHNPRNAALFEELGVDREPAHDPCPGHFRAKAGRGRVKGVMLYSWDWVLDFVKACAKWLSYG